MGVADSVMVGHIGKESLAAASLGNSVFVIFLTFGLGISYGITPLVARADGEKNTQSIMELSSHGLIVNVITSLILFLLLLITSFSFPYLDQPEIVVSIAKPYFLIISLGIIPFMIFQNFRQFAEGLSYTRQAMVITVSGNLINIGLNYILIFGKLGFPAYGLTGAGIATLTSRVIMAIGMAAFILYEKRFKKYRSDFNPASIKKYILKRILSIGLPSGFQFIFEVGAFSSAAIMVGWIGTASLAAHQIAISLASITYMMATGLAAATTIRVGNQWGKKDLEMLRSVGFTGMVMSIMFMGTAAVLFITFKDYFPTLYINDPEVIGIATNLLVIAAFFQISDGLQVVCLGALRCSDSHIGHLNSILDTGFTNRLPVGY